MLQLSGYQLEHFELPVVRLSVVRPALCLPFPVPSPMHICLLDIDGTLILTGSAGHAAFAETLAHEFGIAEMNGDVQFAGRSDRAIVMDLFRHHGVEPSVGNWQRFCRSYLGRLRRVLAARKGRVLPGVEQLLSALSTRGDVAIGLLTGNIRDGARHKLTHYGLWHWFSFGGFGDEHTERCDIAAAALAAAKAHLNGNQHLNGSQVNLGEVVVIGDTIHDIRCARSIGARCVAVATGHSSVDDLRVGEPDIAVETLEDIDAVVAMFASRG